MAHMDVYNLVYVLFRCWDYGGAYGRISFCIGDGISVAHMDVYILGVYITVVHMDVYHCV